MQFTSLYFTSPPSLSLTNLFAHISQNIKLPQNCPTIILDYLNLDFPKEPNLSITIRSNNVFMKSIFLGHSLMHLLA